jgi:hypothetical protein
MSRCSAVELMDSIAVWLRDIVLSYKIVVCTACKSQAYFIELSSCLSVTDNICLHFYFSVIRPDMRGI